MTLVLETVARCGPGAAAVATVVTGPDTGRAVTCGGGRIRIGTDADCDLALTDPTVSRLHCAVQLDEGGASVHDLGSTNGTFVGGHRVRSAYLRSGSLLRLGRTQIRFELEAGSHALAGDDRCGLLLGRSQVMHDMFELVRRVAPTDATVLVRGETGTGKELVAETLHAASHRAALPFVVFDCGRVTPTLIDAELFGNVRGAYTGAVETRIGALESAQDGTVFLDEIGELPLDLQSKLLRAIEHRTITRVGSSKPVRIGARIVAATHRDLDAAVRRGEFRSDLYYRINVITVRVPPLRERLDDLPLLASHFARQCTGDPAAELPQELIDRLRARNWPGNVRELRTAVERWTLLGSSPRAATERVAPIDRGDLDEPDATFRDAKAKIVERWERDYLERLLHKHAGNVSRAARAAKMNRNHLTDLLRRHGVASYGQ